MLQTLNEGYKILQLQDQKLHPLRAFHWITRGNAVALSLEDKIGTLDPGTEADIVVLDSRATDAMAPAHHHHAVAHAANCPTPKSSRCAGCCTAVGPAPSAPGPH